MIRPLTLLTAFAVLLSGCGKQSVPSDEEGDEGQYISFSCSAAQTRSGAGNVLTNTDERLRNSSFGIYGFKTSLADASVNSNMANVFATSGAQEVGWDISDGFWTYSPKRKWELSLYYRFRTFWPYEANVNPASNATRIGVEYRSTSEQYDLLVAYSTRHPLVEGTERVPMKFRHALSGLRFHVKFVEDKTPKGTVDYVTRFYLQGLYSVGYMIYGQQSDNDDVEKIEWIFDRGGNTFDSSSKMFEWTGHEEFSISATATGENKVATVFDNDHVVLIPPQTLSAPSNATPTTANFYTEEGGDALHQVELPETALQPGKIYTFTLLIHSTYVVVNIDIKEWDELQSNVDINL